MSLLRNLAAWMLKRIPGRLEWHRTPVVTFAGQFLFWRFAPFWPDEFLDGGGKHWHRPPWWRPFGVMLHCWELQDGVAEEFHDHPRWSVTVCLSGRIVEMTPWGERVLRAGSVVVRSRKMIHAFRAPDGYAGKTWTLFIVGRRNHGQQTYAVIRQRGYGQVGGQAMKSAGAVLAVEAQARLDADLAAMTPWAQLARFIDDLWADYQAELAADRRRLFALAQRRLNQRYERRREQHRRDFAAQMRAQGYAEVDGGAFGLVTPKGSLDVAESPE